MSDGTEFTVDVDVRTQGAEPAAVALARLAEKLTSSGTAAVQAAEAQRGGEAAYKQAEAAANKAALAVEKIGASADAQRGKLQKAMDVGDVSAAARAALALQNLTQRQADAGAKAASTAAAMNSAAASLDKLRGSAAAAADNEARLAKGLDAAKSAASASAKAQADAAKTSAAAQQKAAAQTAKAQEAAAGSGKANEAAEGFGKLGGPLGAIGQKAFGAADALKKLSGSLGSAGPYAAVAVAIAAIVVSVLAVGAAMVVATGHILAFAIANTDAARSQSLLAAGAAGSVRGGAELEATIERLGNIVPQTADELIAMAADLRKTGLSGDALSVALEQAAVKGNRSGPS